MRSILLAAASIGLFLASAHAADRPNLIVIMVDDMGFSDIGPYGSEIPTPHLDQLAAGGVKFSQFYNTGRCCPTRASLLTGLYPHAAGVGHMTRDEKLPGYRGQLLDDTLTIAEVLGEAGYFTSMSGKWHVGWNHGVTPAGRGFQCSLNTAAGGLHFDDQTGTKGGTKLYRNGDEIPRQAPSLSPPWYGTHQWTDFAIRCLDEARAADKPLFHYLAHIAPHFPCMAPEETIAKYRGKYLEGWDKLRVQRHERQKASGLIDPAWQLEPRPGPVPAWGSLEKKKQQRYDDMMAIYAAMIEEIDKSIGTLVAALEERGELDNTLIFFLSDNGGNAEAGVEGRYEGEHPGDAHSNVFVGRCWAHLQNTPFREYKHYNHEGGIATPLIAHWPAGIARKDRWERTPAHVIDLMATAIDLADTSYPATRAGKPVKPLAGTSLLPLLTGEGSLPERPLFWEHEGNAAVRIGDWKLVRKGRGGTWELFDLAKDRTEQHDLAATKPDKRDELLAAWREWARTSNVVRNR